MKRDVRCRMCGIVLGRYGVWRRLLGLYPPSCTAADNRPSVEDACIERFRTGRGLRRP